MTEPTELLEVPTHDLAAKIWAETVRETKIWQHTPTLMEELAEFARVLIPKYRKALADAREQGERDAIQNIADEEDRLSDEERASMQTESVAKAFTRAMERAKAQGREEERERWLKRKD